MVMLAAMTTIGMTETIQKGLEVFVDTASDTITASKTKNQSATNNNAFNYSEDSRINLPEIASQYPFFRCREAAEAMKKANRNRGKIVQLYFPYAYNGYVVSERYPNTAISHTGVHFGYLYKENVYCNIYPEGKPLSQWICSFSDAFGEKPIVTYY